MYSIGYDSTEPTVAILLEAAFEVFYMYVSWSRLMRDIVAKAKANEFCLRAVLKDSLSGYSCMKYHI